MFFIGGNGFPENGNMYFICGNGFPENGDRYFIGGNGFPEIRKVVPAEKTAMPIFYHTGLFVGVPLSVFRGTMFISIL